MIAPANADARRLFVRMWRLRLALWAMHAARAFDALAERLLPEDFRRAGDGAGAARAPNLPCQALLHVKRRELL